RLDEETHDLTVPGITSGGDTPAAQISVGEETSMSTRDTLGVAVVGAGYWGPNLIRNFRSSDDWDLVAVCDLDVERAQHVLGNRSGVDVTDSLDAVLARDDVHAVAIATPARTHRGIAEAALLAGKHVL